VQFDSLADGSQLGVAPRDSRVRVGHSKRDCYEPGGACTSSLDCLAGCAACSSSFVARGGWRVSNVKGMAPGGSKYVVGDADAGCCRSDCGGGTRFASDRAASRLGAGRWRGF